MDKRTQKQLNRYKVNQLILIGIEEVEALDDAGAFDIRLDVEVRNELADRSKRIKEHQIKLENRLTEKGVTPPLYYPRLPND